MGLGLLVAGRPDGQLVGRLGQPLGGPPGRLDRLRQGPAQAQDLGPVDQALAGEGDQSGLAVAPRAQRRGPLAGPAQLGHLLADLDHPAVDGARHRRRELAGHGRHHRLVEHGQAAGTSPPVTAAAPWRNWASATRSASPARRPIPAAARRRRLGSGVVPGVELLHGRRDQQVALLGAVRRLVLQQPPGPGQPAAALGQLAPAEQHEAEPEGAAGRPPVVALAGEDLLGPLQGGHGLGDPATEVGRGHCLLQVVGRPGGSPPHVKASHHIMTAVSPEPG